MKQPIGFSDTTNRICLYGLKQAPRCWNKKFVNFRKAFDSGVFISIRTGGRTLMAIYVDEGLIITESEDDIKMLISYLDKVSEIKYVL